LEKVIISKNLINKITHRVPIREKAFFTIMRQSGLTPKAITRLRLENFELSNIIPRKIDTRQELKQNTTKKPPHFIGEEANKYIKQYLSTRQNLTRESLLFATKNNPNKEISTKNMSRAFRDALEDTEKEMTSINAEKSVKKNFSLLSLTEFYRENAKPYKKELESHPNENDDYYRNLYKHRAMPFLEIESPIIIKINPTKKRFRNEIEKRDNQIKEMTQTIAKDNEYIGSILTLLYNNNGDPETGENEKIGDDFIELWKATSDKQMKNMDDSWGNWGILLPYEDIVEELTKTLKRIKKPYDELEQRQLKAQQGNSMNSPENQPKRLTRAREE
jgi:hypothetical protein